MRLLPQVLVIIIMHSISCKDTLSYEPVVISENLLCEIQEEFNGVWVYPGPRPCQDFVRVNYYWFTFDGNKADSNKVDDYHIFKIKDRYKLVQDKNNNKYVSYLFEKTIHRMEKYGIKCIYIMDRLYNKDTLFVDIPCQKHSFIYFYADRITLEEIPLLSDINLKDYESIMFSMYPHEVSKLDSVSNVFPGTLWYYKLFEKYK